MTRRRVPEGARATTSLEEVFDKMHRAAIAATAGRARSAGARPIAVPLSMSSFAPETVARFGQYLDAMGFIAVPSGSHLRIEDGDVRRRSEKPASLRATPIGAVLLNGDFNVAATGTVTHVDGDRVYAFGHPFLDIGEISFPMAKSEIVTVMPSLASSFKFANTGAIVGALQQDRAAGIMGERRRQRRHDPGRDDGRRQPARRRTITSTSSGIRSSRR